jgi:CRP-like cAMP-binding protein
VDVREFLKTVPEFSPLVNEDIELLAAIARVAEVKAGASVDVQGKPADKFCILVSGRLGVTLDLDLGVSKKSYIVTTVGPGQMFAWSGLVGNPHYTAGSRAMTDCMYLEFDTDRLNRAFVEDPRLGYAVMQMVARGIAGRLRAMQLQLVQQYALSEAE